MLVKCRCDYKRNNRINHGTKLCNAVLCLLWETAMGTSDLMQKGYGEESMTYTSVFSQRKIFSECWESRVDEH
jgi:hypothetical protein